jgi:hypothetical protein
MGMAQQQEHGRTITITGNALLTQNREARKCEQAEGECHEAFVEARP